MLSYVIVDGNGNQKTVKAVLTAVMNSDLDVPADDLTVTFPYDKSFAENANYITAFLDGELVFRGQIDEIIKVKNETSVITSVTARSLAAFLLDNEAEPVTYVNPAADFIADRHLKPFGISADSPDGIPFYGNLKIDKGMTHWQVVKNFCKNRYGSTPRITGSGQALLKGYEDSEVKKFGGGETEYYSIKENNKPCELISEVKLKLKDLGSYDAGIKNENDACKNIKRIRYVDATADTSTVETADAVILQSNTDSYYMTLECAGCGIDLIGRFAEVSDGVFGKTDKLRVCRTKYVLDKDGEHTTVCLRKEWS